MLDLTVASLATVAGDAAVTAIIVQLVLNALQLPQATMDRVGPVLAVGVGILVALVATLSLGIATPDGIIQAVLTGLAAGTSAMGIHNLITKTGGLATP